MSAGRGNHLSTMGIGDRDYMRRPSDEDGRSGPSHSRTEDFLAGLLKRHPKAPKYFAIAIGVLVVAGIVAAEVISR